MAKVKRYSHVMQKHWHGGTSSTSYHTCGGIRELEHGEFVAHTSYERLKKQNKELKNKVKELEKMVAENEQK